MRKMSGSTKGFTLIELMITVVIIGIVAGLAAPSFERAWIRHSFKSGNRAIVSALKTARSMAVSTKEPHGVHFTDNSGIVTVFKNSSGPSGLSFDGGDSTVTVDTLPHEFEYVFTDFENGVIIFQANGSADFEGYGQILTMAETEGMTASYYTTVLASTGKVETQSYYYAW